MLGLFSSGHRHDDALGDGEEQDGRTASEIGGPVGTGTTTEMLPPAASWIRDGVLHKRVTGNGNTTWQLRHIVLSKDHILITKPEVDRVVESIPLHEVSGCVQKSEEESGMVDPRQDTSPMSPMRPTSTVRRQKSLNPFTNAQARGIFEVMTTEDGYNGGRSYTLQCATLEEGLAWVDDIQKCARAAAVKRNLVKEDNQLEKVQRKVKAAYDSELCQSIVAGLIIANFATSIADAELMPKEGTRTYDVLADIDLTFTIVFAVELVINMFGNWTTDIGRRFPSFFYDGWNIFDLLVVTISVVAASFADAPGVNGLRILRVFRVMRVFRRLGSLRVLINALTSSIVPVLNAFVVLMLVTAVYAVLAVMLFKDLSEDLFGNFSSSIFTMFQVCTGDGWASTIVRPLWKHPGEVDPVLAIFFVSYILIVGTFLINIVIAVLLDEFISSVEAEKSQVKLAQIQGHEREFQKSQGALDPVIKAFTTFTTPEDLDKEIDHLYDTLDTDESGGLTYDELEEGLRKLPFEPRIHLSEEDFDAITEGKNLVNDEGEVDRPSFFAIVKRQMVAYVHKWLRHKMRDSEDDQYTLLVALKQLILLTNTQGAEERTETSLSNIQDRLTSIEAMIRAIAPAEVSDARLSHDSEEMLAKDEERRRRTAMFDRHVSTIHRDHQIRRKSLFGGLSPGAFGSSVDTMKSGHSPGLGLGLRAPGPPTRTGNGGGSFKGRGPQTDEPAHNARTRMGGSWTASEAKRPASPSGDPLAATIKDVLHNSVRRVSCPENNLTGTWERRGSIGTIYSVSAGSNGTSGISRSESAEKERQRRGERGGEVQGTPSPDTLAGDEPVDVPVDPVVPLPPSAHGSMLSAAGCERHAQPTLSEGRSLIADEEELLPPSGDSHPRIAAHVEDAATDAEGIAQQMPLAPIYRPPSNHASPPPLAQGSIQASTIPPVPVHAPPAERPAAHAPPDTGGAHANPSLVALPAFPPQSHASDTLEHGVPRLAPAPRTLRTRRPSGQNEPTHISLARPLPQTPPGHRKENHGDSANPEAGMWMSGMDADSVGLDEPQSVTMKKRRGGGDAGFVSAQFVVASPLPSYDSPRGGRGRGDANLRDG